MKNGQEFMAALFGVAVGIVAGFFLALGTYGDSIYNSGKQQIRLEAAEAGVAQFVADPKTGVTEFKWNTVESLLQQANTHNQNEK